MPTPAENADWFVHEATMLAREFVESQDDERNHALVLGKIQGHVRAAHVTCGSETRDRVTRAIQDVTGTEPWWNAPDEQ